MSALAGGAGDGAEVELQARLASFKKDVENKLPKGLTRVCVLGGRKVTKTDVTTPLIESIARELQQFSTEIVVITGGMPGVQETFAKNLSKDVGLYNLLPVGDICEYGVGTDLACGNSLEERMKVFGRIAHIYLTFEGGPGVGGGVRGLRPGRGGAGVASHRRRQRRRQSVVQGGPHKGFGEAGLGFGR